METGAVVVSNFGSFLEFVGGVFICSSFLNGSQSLRGWNKGSRVSQDPGTCYKPQRSWMWVPFETLTPVTPFLSTCGCVGGALEGSSRNYGVGMEEGISRTNLDLLNGHVEVHTLGLTIPTEPAHDGCPTDARSIGWAPSRP